MTALQIRDVPDELHRTLKARAALAGQSVSEYALAQLARALERPTRDELMARIASREPVDLSVSAADLIRAERDAR